MPSASPYVESRVDLFDKRETADLAQRLGVSVVTAVGHLHALWHYVKKTGSPDGDISRLGPRELAEAARWDGEPGVLQEALLEGEWLDRSGTVHNWVLYYGREGDTRAQTRERQRRWREQQRGFTDQQIWERDGGSCRFCGAKVTLKGINVTWITSLTKGGNMTLDNAVTACERCRKRKWGRAPDAVGMPIMGRLDDAGVLLTREQEYPGVSLTRYQDSPGVSLTRYQESVLLTRDIDSAYGTEHDPSAEVSLTRYQESVLLTRYGDQVTAEHDGEKQNAVCFSSEGEKQNAVCFSKSAEPDAVTFLAPGEKQNNVCFSPDAPSAPLDPPGVSLTRYQDSKPPERVNTGTGVLTRDLTGDALSLNPGVQGVESTAAPKKRGGKREPKPERVEAAERLYGLFKKLVNPGARSCPTDKILKRLERFSEDEVAMAIGKFSADAWWSTHCDDKPASWFFRSDDQIEKFLIMRVRPKAGQVEQPSWLAEIKNTNSSIGASTLTGDDDSHTPPAPSEEPPMIAASSATEDDSDVAF